MSDKRKEHRDKLLRAAYDLVAEVGISGLRTRDIADRAGVNIATLHYRFAGKDALLQALYEYIRDRFREGAERRLAAANTAERKIVAEAEMRIHLAREESKSVRVWRTFVGEAWVNPFIREIVRRHFSEQRERFAATIAAAAETGGLKSLRAADRNSAASLLVSLMDGLLTQSAMDPDAFALEDYADAMYALLGIECTRPESDSAAQCAAAAPDAKTESSHTE